MTEKYPYIQTRQALGKLPYTDALQEVKNQLEIIEKEATKWLSCSKSKTHETICGYYLSDLMRPIDIENYLSFKVNRMLNTNAIAFASFTPDKALVSDNQLKVFLTKYPKVKDEPQANQIVKLLKHKRRAFQKYILDWVKCQVLTNSTEPPLLLPFSEVLADMYTSKSTYLKACKHNSLLILEMPATIANNKQLVDILLDILHIRVTFAPTLLRSVTGKCMAKLADTTVNVSTDFDILDMARKNEPRIEDYSIPFEYVYDDYSKFTFYSNMDIMLILNGWIKFPMNTEETK